MPSQVRVLLLPPFFKRPVFIWKPAFFLSALGQARRAGEVGGTLPAVLNAANEIAVDAFCDGHTSFVGIASLVTEVMDQHQVVEHPSLDEIIEADQWARETARDLVGLGQAIA